MPLAKLSRPNAAGLLARERLFLRLTQACSHSSVWITAPAGAGKTSLVTSYLESCKIVCLWYQLDIGDADLATFFHYLSGAVQALSPREPPLPNLTAEYLPGLETFTRRFFRLLFDRFAAPVTLVLDNFQEAPADAPLHGVLATALTEVPPGSTILFISRHDPPAPLARAYTNSATLDWDDLKLTQTEAEAFARHHGYTQTDSMQALIDAAQGWAAGLVLLTRAPGNGATLLPEMRQQQVLYNYFTQEIFRRIPDIHQDILLKTALLPLITPAAAQQISGLEYAPKILADLHRERFFTEFHSGEEAAYQYHPLFREFLLKRSEEIYSPAYLITLKRHAAELLKAGGQIEAAVELFAGIAAWDEIGRIVMTQAPGLLAQGRNTLLDRWIEQMPANLREDHPWFRYWHGLSRMPFNPPECRPDLESAFSLFKNQDDVTGMYLALSAVLTSFFYEWGDMKPLKPWLAELERLLERYPDFPSIEVESRVAMGMMAVVLHNPQHPLLRRFKDRTLPLLRLCQTPQQRILVSSPALLNCLWSGEFAEAGRILDEIKATLDTSRISPVDHIGFKITEAIYAWRRSAHTEAYGIIAEARALARDSGVHLLDAQIAAQTCWTALGAGDLKLAAQSLAEAKSLMHPMRRSDIISLSVLEHGLALLRGEVNDTALKAMRGVIAEAQEVATLYGEAEARMLCSQMLIAANEYTAVTQELTWLKDFAIAMPCPHIAFRTFMFEANTAFLTGREAEGFDRLRQSLAIGRAHAYTNTHPFWQPEVVSRLLAKALEAEIEVDYVQRFIRARDLPAPSLDSEHWPWPVMIHTLGRFTIVIDGQPLRFHGKTQKKPLDLLKALIAHGGRGINQKLLIDDLWPDLDGDAGHNACDLALHRLRKLLLHSDALGTQEGKLEINARRVWVDVWAFERFGTMLERGTLEKTEPCTAQRLLRLYPGHFLASEDPAWALAARERLRSKFLRYIALLGRELEQAGAWTEVTTLYRHAIELDPLAEESYRGLMLSYRAQGRIAEALETYQRCHELLSIRLGIKPSAQTEAIYRSLTSS